MATSTFRSLFAGLSLSSPPLSALALTSTKAAAGTPAALLSSVMTRSIHSTSAQNAKQTSNRSKKKKKNRADLPDPRIVNLKRSMPRAVPAPLRFARNRHLRHWTIHRAWLLYQRQEREREQHELERAYQSMSNACEELRKTSGPGTRTEGYLYRVAMEKKGMFGHNAIPIEYARMQTETPAREPWNHGWTR
ncbi:hypothetical protein F4778DRAFT_780783 [Xylariomycetidae sp. FL2044]|nr:hypothetical protein F4778DRAFT_780783 [Xylariomycetidae sp. FL2044]